MRILVLIHEFPPVGGGGGRVVEDVYQGLHKLGHETCVVTPHFKGLPKREKRGGVQIWRIPSGRIYPYKATLFDMTLYVLMGFIRCLPFIRTWRPDVIHVHFAVPAGALAWGLSKITKVPYIITAHLGDVPGGSPTKTDNWFWWIYPFTPMIWKSASRITSVSEHTKSLTMKHYPGDIQVIPNGVNLDELSPGEIRVGLPPRIVFAGRFVHQKNLLTLVRILNKVQDLDWDCVLLGDGELRKEIENEIKLCNLQDRVSLLGWVTPEDVIDWFGKSDILLMPSLWEGLPVVGVQALSMGLAIIASHVGGLLDLVDSGKNGYLIELNDTVAWEQHLRSLLNDRDKLRKFRNSSRKAAEKFSLPEIVRAYEEVLLKALENS
jgi:glycosyltransferase involved in cell wall biosynthesis